MKIYQRSILLASLSLFATLSVNAQAGSTGETNFPEIQPVRALNTPSGWLNCLWASRNPVLELPTSPAGDVPAYKKGSFFGNQYSQAESFPLGQEANKLETLRDWDEKEESQDQRFGPDPASGNGKPWQFSVGVGAIHSRRYEGSDEYRTIALPNFSAEYKDGLFFAGIFDGIGSYFLRGENYKFGASIGFAFGRQEKDDRENLTGLGDIDTTATGSLMGEYGFGPFQVSGKVTTGTEEFGTTAEFEFGTMFPLSERFMLSAQVGGEWADSKHMNTYFGITEEQSLRSGYSHYLPESGFKSAGVSIGAFYTLSEKWQLMVMLNGKKLLGDAADSPIIKDDLDPGFIFITNYKF